MKKLVLLFLLLIPGTIFAQYNLINANGVLVKDSLYLKNLWINEFSTDQNLGISDNKIPTQRAVKLYVDGLVSGGITANNGLTKTGNTLTLGGSLNAGVTQITSIGNDRALLFTSSAPGISNAQSSFQSSGGGIVLASGDQHIISNISLSMHPSDQNSQRGITMAITSPGGEIFNKVYIDSIGFRISTDDDDLETTDIFRFDNRDSSLTLKGYENPNEDSILTTNALGKVILKKFSIGGDLQAVTDVGASTSNAISVTAGSFVGRGKGMHFRSQQVFGSTRGYISVGEADAGDGVLFIEAKSLRNITDKTDFLMNGIEGSFSMRSSGEASYNDIAAIGDNSSLGIGADKLIKIITNTLQLEGDSTLEIIKPSNTNTEGVVFIDQSRDIFGWKYINAKGARAKDTADFVTKSQLDSLGNINKSLVEFSLVHTGDADYTLLEASGYTIICDQISTNRVLTISGMSLNNGRVIRIILDDPAGSNTWTTNVAFKDGTTTTSTLTATQTLQYDATDGIWRKIGE